MIGYRASWVVPVVGEPIRDGIVVVAGERIAFVGAAADAPRSRVEELGDCVLMPGLVNCHTHLELTAMRGALEDMPFERWISSLRSARADVMSERDLLDAARWGLAEGLLAGVTTYADCAPGLAAMTAMRELNVRGVAYQEVFAPDPSRCESALSELTERVGAAGNMETPLVRSGVSPHAPYTVCDELFARVARLASDGALPVAVHAAESAAESALVVGGSGPFADALRTRGIAVAERARSTVALLHREGVLGERTLLIHCVRVDPEDIAMIAESGSAVAHCPVSNAKLGHGVAPLAEMLAAGVRVGLGSDSMASNNRMDLLEEARVAMLMQAARGAEVSPPDAGDVLEMATVAGARCLGLQSSVGSLEVGKQADLAAFSLADPAGVPFSGSAADIVFALPGRRASFVAVAGRPLVRDGVVLNLDSDLRDRVQALGDSLRRRARLPQRSPASGALTA